MEGHATVEGVVPETGVAIVRAAEGKTERSIDLFHKWLLLHGNEACMLFSQSILVSNYQTDMKSFWAFSLLIIRISF